MRENDTLRGEYQMLPSDPCPPPEEFGTADNGAAEIHFSAEAEIAGLPEEIRRSAETADEVWRWGAAVSEEEPAEEKDKTRFITMIRLAALFSAGAAVASVMGFSISGLGASSDPELPSEPATVYESEYSTEAAGTDEAFTGEVLLP